ncbi:MAG: Eco57I restriction-modification methylase domain-containing protein [Thermoleophilia bacterium]
MGNPPYGLITDEQLKNHYLNKYQASEGRFDIYELFIEQGLKLVRRSSLLGFIVPSPFLSNLYARKLRQFILTNSTIEELTNFGMDVFADPTIHTCIVILARHTTRGHQIRVRKQVATVSQLKDVHDYELPQDEFTKKENSTFDIFIDPRTAELISKLYHNSQLLRDICFIRQCIKTGNDKLHVTKSSSQPDVTWKPSLRGKSIIRYASLEKDLWLNYGTWLARNWKNTSFYETQKIAIRETGNRITATIDNENRYFLSSLYSIYPKKDKEPWSLLFILGMLNSILATYFVKKIAFDLTYGAFTKVRTNQLGRFPIPCINLTDPTDKARHDRMVDMVEQMLELNKQLQAAKTPYEKNSLQRQIEATDRRIDQLVYELYELTDEEIRIVESEGQ